MVMRLALLKSCFAMAVRSSSALVMYRSMMPSSFIFFIYVANFDWRRRANLILKLLWCFSALVSAVVVFLFVLLLFVLCYLQVVDLYLPRILLTLYMRYLNVHNKGQLFWLFYCLWLLLSIYPCYASCPSPHAVNHHSRHAPCRRHRSF